jgi:nucleoside-diphosphate-sugar epimerase
MAVPWTPPPGRFLARRNLLFTVAYEILGSAADAEDVLQETWLRWAGVDLDTVQDQRASWSGSPPARRSTGCEHSAAARVLHLATRIPSLERRAIQDAWRENDRLRAAASKVLVDAAIAAGAAVYVQLTVTFVYPRQGSVSEAIPIADVPPILRSALAAEQQAQRFAQAGGRGVVLRFGLLDGPGTGNDQPVRDFGATLHVQDAARALVAALALPSGTYNVCRDGEHVSNDRFTRAAGWHPRH